MDAVIESGFGGDEWKDTQGEVSRVVVEQSERCLRSYAANPVLIEEHANIERSTTQGGYGRRQLYELVQNGADELQNDPGGGIQVVLTQETLYCANRGTPISPDGVDTILASHLSRKRGSEIGRFGLGFKSVLSVSSSPQFFSRTGSFGWDAAWAEAAIRGRVPDYTGPTPVLRMARLLDAAEERRKDSVLHELMEWASTVVKLPLLEGHDARLARDLDRFPAKFVIFSPHVGELILDNRLDPLKKVQRGVWVRDDGPRRSLHTMRGDEEDTSEWIVFQTTHTPSRRARMDAGEYHERREIPLGWAVPISGGTTAGEFWAFFPTTYETTLRGVLNAPWKTNEDRQNLLKDNAFNEELMAVAADLIVSSFPALSTSQDPARHLTLITARGREARNWADEMLTELVYRVAAQKPSLPDQDGRLQRPDVIKLHPEKLERKWLEHWSAYPGRPTGWCHPSVEETTRRARVEMILQRAGRGPATVRAWLEALASDGTVEASAAALSIAADMVHQDHPAADEARRARIVRTDDGRLVSAIADTVFIRTPLDVDTDDLTFVDPALSQDPAVMWSLANLGIREADAVGRLASVLHNGLDAYGSEEWSRFWELTRAAGVEGTRMVFDEHGIESAAICVYTVGGIFRPLSWCLLPGAVVQSPTEDPSVTIDVGFHRSDIGLLKALGASDRPGLVAPAPDEAWYAEYSAKCVDLYLKKLRSAGINNPPSAAKVAIDGPTPAGPLGLLRELSGDSRARFIQNMPETGLVARWKVRSNARRNLPVIDVMSPLVWMTRKHGLLPTSQGLRPVTRCMASTLNRYERVLPVARIDASIGALLELPTSLEEIDGKVWGELLEEVKEWRDDTRVGTFYSMAETQLVPPDEINCRTNEGWRLLAPGEVAAAADREQYDRLVAHNVAAILVDGPEAAGRLIDTWGLKSLAEALKIELRPISSREPTPLEDLFPQLRNLPDRPLHDLSLIRCDELEELVTTPQGLTTRQLEIGWNGGLIYYAGTDDGLPLLKRLNVLLGLGLSDSQCEQVLRHREQARKSDLVTHVRRQQDDIGRLNMLLGRQAILERLPAGLVEQVEADEGPLDERSLCHLALSVYQTGILTVFRDELERKRLTVPIQMAGGPDARKFVTDLGFPSEYAGSRMPALPAVETVDGPVDFPALHEYQERLIGRIMDVLQRRDVRGLLSLPTGAGKTRITVEAVSRSLRTLSDDRAAVPVLWVAQTEELCEQAVQTWRDVWRATGPAKSLTISRLWSTNSAQPVTSGYHLVVATDAKLDEVVASDEYGWLRNAQTVVVDEAHTSITPRYTRVFASLGLDQRSTRCPLVGLTATPFRGRNDDETRRLITRYAGNRLDFTTDGTEILTEEPYRYLQDLEVLARVRHMELAGAELSLKPDEIDRISQLRRLPHAAEQRLGVNVERNRALIELIVGFDPTWPVLLYATSVDHARAMAALLQRKCVPAASVDSQMGQGTRRRVIEKFKLGQIRVLTNYGVLTQGFDAPATRVVVVARPTYSPNVYQQMIGRGLRGPKNGGKKECLIVNIADNILQYGEQLAFREFEYLWRQGATVTEEYTRETPEDFVGLPWDTRALVTAGPGSGKTHSLIRRLAYLIDEEGLDPDEVIALSFSRAAVREIKARLAIDDSDARYVEVRTFDSFATWLLSRVDPESSWERVDYDGRIRAAVNALNEKDEAAELMAEIRHVTVDEIQDLVEERAELIKALLSRIDGGFTLLGDPAQGIYGFQIEDRRERIRGSTGLFDWVGTTYDGEVEPATLRGNHRARSDDARAALPFGPLLADSQPDYRKIAHELRTTLVTGGRYFGALADSAWLLEKGPSTAVLCRNNGEALLVSRELSRLNVPHRLQRSTQDRVVASWAGALFLGLDRSHPSQSDVMDVLEQVRLPDGLTPVDLVRVLKRISGGPRNAASLDLYGVRRRLAQGLIPDELLDQRPTSVVVSTIHRVKGLEFDRVIIVDTGDPDDEPVEQAELARLLYVAMTRPRDTLCWTDRVLPPPGHRMAQFGDRWYESGFGAKSWLRFGMEIRDQDAHRVDPAGTVGYKTDARRIQCYLRDRLPLDSPVTLDRLDGDDPPRYDIRHDGVHIGVTSESFGYALRGVLGRSHYSMARWPRRITEVRVETVETVSGSDAAAINSGLGDFGVWLRPRLCGLGRFDWQED